MWGFPLCNLFRADAVDSLKHMKRKSQAAFGGETGEEEGIDRQFLLADRQILAKLRADELPAHTRSTVLNAPTTVSAPTSAKIALQ